ncbi:MAG: RibD family protein, partial [Hyphomonadaceae bacterium]|nr:RibD family protein [Hyphomonadaceae bacterium]
MTVRVSLKFATSLDGRIATASGESRWITGEAARMEGHRLRAAHDAILVGAGTALADDPELTVRLPDQPTARQPVRVVLDTRLRLSPQSRLARTVARGPVLVIGGAGALADGLTAAGVGVAYAPLRDDRPDIRAVLAILGARGVSSLLVEGGGEVAAAFVRARC